MARSLAAALLGVALLLAGCGYRFETARGGRFGDPSVRILLAPFENATPEAGAGALISGALREELRRDGLAGSFAGAPSDFVVEGTVRAVTEEILGHDDAGYGQEYRLSIRVDVRVLESARGHLLWREEGITESAPFFASTDYSFTRANRHRALEEACRRLARRMSRTLRTIL